MGGRYWTVDVDPGELVEYLGERDLKSDFLSAGEREANEDR